MLNLFLRAAALLLAVTLVPAQAQTGSTAVTPPKKALAAGAGGTEPSNARILLPATSPFLATAGVPVEFSGDLNGGRSPKWTLNGVQIATGLGPFTYTFSAAGTYTVNFVVLPDSVYAGSTASVVVQVMAAQTRPAISAFTASPASVPFGGTSTLAWSTSGGTSYTLSPGGGVSTPSGSLGVQPTATTTYTLSVTNGVGTTQATATVVVSPVTVTISPKPAGTSVAAGSVNTFYATLAGVGGSASQQIAWTASGGSPTSFTGPAFTWTAPATGTPVTITAASVANPAASDSFTLNAVPPATVALTTLRAAINQGESTVLNWSVSGASAQTLNGEPVEANGSRSVSPTTTTTYVLAATNAMQVQTVQTLTVKVMGILGWKRDIVYLGTREVGVVENNGTLHTTLVDSLGSPRFEVNEAGTVEGEQKYLPFGMLAWPGEKLETGKGFTGHEQTDPSGLIYMQARFYLPMYGRFASPDPARDQHFEQTQSWNIYSYVQNNPVMMLDPNGMAGVPWYLGGNSTIVDKTLNALYSATVTHNPGFQVVAQATDVVSAGINAVGNQDIPMLSNIGKDAENGAGAKDLLLNRSMEVPTAVMEGEVGGALLGRATSFLARSEAGAVAQELKASYSPNTLLSRQSSSEMSGSLIKRMAKDMKANGFDASKPIQIAVVDGKRIILDGHHRVAAAIKAGIREVPVLIKKVSDKEGAELLRQVAEARS
ncbi:RHS repeat-associated core domain-containing protein [Mesoterricola sediminis]|uniref:ParB-like N-terminal domain-containing protein n=1 Tax=Mesoterricola sediminis TaxID=2927980 RepID=A0AA48GQ26_9BACT|nr:RHS repeat-associated core domain-containing protein [Mesoterricola sediminis]BDU75474.1 hypothetical protein METESE_04320 [Mesoterricola sediminis]